MVIIFADHPISCKIDCFAHSHKDNMMTNDEIPIITHKVERNERNLFEIIDENAWVINSNRFIIIHY